MKRLWKNLFSRSNDEIEIHVAGATVRHKNPFGNLSVARNLEELDEVFVEKWVVPFYMNGFSNFSEDIKEKFIDIFPQINSEIIAKLLGDFNWRTRIVGAYFAALKDLVEFEEIIGTHLLKSEVCYAGSGYCLALASFGTENSRKFLKTYLDYYLTRKDLWFDQSDALSALFWMDEKETKKYDSLWNDFAADKSNRNLETSKENFAKSTQNLKEIRKSATKK